ncbi:MAG: mechanosensitive ion channel domain-containing protein, partial [Cyanobacteria bacterium P01_G01_bin.4]
ALSIAVGAIAVSFGLQQIRVKLVQANRNALSKQATQADKASLSENTPIVEPESETELESTGEQENDNAGSNAPSEELSPQASKQKLKYDLTSKALQITQVAVWIVGTIGIANLFPYTRWITVVAFSTISGVVLELLVIIVVTYLLLRIIESAIEHLFAAIAEGRFITVDTSPRLTQRIETFSGVIKGAALVLISGVGTLVGLATIGIDIAPILAGAGILGLAVSFGAQSLVKDIINGFFILLEDQYGVGDVVSIDGSSGFVERMNLRITQLRSGDGNLITVPNGSITVVENLTSHWSRVNLGIEVAYSTDLDKAIEVIGREARQMLRERYWKDLIVDEPQVLGVDGFGENSIIIRLWIKTLPLKHFEVGREYRKRIKKAFDREGISIPFPQRSIWFENELTSSISASGDRKALSNGN